MFEDVNELRAAAEAGTVDVHVAAAAAIFGLESAQVGPAERRWGKWLNMAALLGLSEAGLADLCQAPREKVREMLDRYRVMVLM